jgi:hypothetical protein
MAIEDREFRIDGYRFLPKSMLAEFKAFPYQAEEVVVAAPMVPVRLGEVCRIRCGRLRVKFPPDV